MGQPQFCDLHGESGFSLRNQESGSPSASVTYCSTAVRMISDSESPSLSDSSCSRASKLAGAMKFFITRGFVGSRFGRATAYHRRNYTTNHLTNQ
jgi:hypothetical protein